MNSYPRLVFHTRDTQRVRSQQKSLKNAESRRHQRTQQAEALHHFSATALRCHLHKQVKNTSASLQRTAKVAAASVIRSSKHPTPCITSKSTALSKKSASASPAQAQAPGTSVSHLSAHGKNCSSDASTFCQSSRSSVAPACIKQSFACQHQRLIHLSAQHPSSHSFERSAPSVSFKRSTPSVSFAQHLSASRSPLSQHGEAEQV